MGKSDKKNISGKSLVFNLISIAVNLTGLTFLGMGYHEAFEESALTFQIIGYVLFILGLVALMIFEGWLLFAQIGRVIVGGLFIVSGLIKANDPKGFGYKLEEYFEDGALAYRVKDIFGWDTFSLEFLIEYALAISIIICILEILLGVMILLGTKMRLASWLTLLMMIFFTLLTWHTSQCDPNSTFKDVDVYALSDPEGQVKIEQAQGGDENIKILNKAENSVTIQEIKKPQCVTDCGCFGDALKGSVGRSLTPEESFWKDIILLYLVIIIFISRRRILSNTLRENLVIVFLGWGVVAFFCAVFSWIFPLVFAISTILLALWIKKAGGKLFGNDLGLMLIVIFTSGLFVTYVLSYRPLKDYRPYAVGNDLNALMNDGEEGVYENIIKYKNKQTGRDTTLTKLDSSTKAIWGNPDVWEYVDRETITVKPAKLATIQQFDPKVNVQEITQVERSFPFIAQKLKENMSKYVEVIDKNTGDRYPQLLEDFYLDDWDTSQYIIGDTVKRLDESLDEISLKDYILEQDQIILIVSRNISEGNFSRIQRLREVADKAREYNIPVIMITTSSTEQIKAFREKYELNIPTVINDETELKALTRSNPTLMVLKKGVVSGKYAFRSTPSWDWLVTNVIDINNK
ncbi:MAG: DoxX family membrane protein [Brumimicrobium sp.]|nr:DoxX family membrane protein [Brumimicrobium sp.]